MSGKLAMAAFVHFQIVARKPGRNESAHSCIYRASTEAQCETPIQAGPPPGGQPWPSRSDAFSWASRRPLSPQSSPN
ncbi:hypothetical protein NGR_c22020 [Sinorhizobium fredii NGR234]|uniref:Uncharacterized protein n=1 Tax=Sinorhizobium fredii (strain NBRC 101917 / NGR234) TaxID=394 RepID=C3MEX1_SINFN|nr:hypothetical protein NGR_c22020 [Sinorhizobium fredii NGR234]